MSYAQQMTQTNPSTGAIKAPSLANAIEACFACAQACTACADACLGEQGVAPLLRCVRLNLDCADLCTATGRILSRQFAADAAILREALQACEQACKHCGDECSHHAQHGMEHCRVCAEACRRCALACHDLLATMA